MSQCRFKVSLDGVLCGIVERMIENQIATRTYCKDAHAMEGCSSALCARILWRFLLVQREPKP